MISREFVVRYYPEFVKLVDKEIKQANKRARESAVEIKLKKSRPRQKPYIRLDKRGYAKGTVEKVALLASQGMDKGDIAEELDLAFSTVAHYLTLARNRGILPKDFYVRDGYR